MDPQHAAQRRLQSIASHLHDDAAISQNCLTTAACASKNRSDPPTCDVRKLNILLYRDHLEYREKVKRIFTHDRTFQNDPEVIEKMNLEQIRQSTLDKIRRIYDHRLVSVNDIQNDTYKYFAFFESFASNATDFGMKFSLSFHFFGSALVNMGTEIHKKYIPGVDSGEILGCFAMTEFAHGSNVREIQTTATFDKTTDEFVINTPNDSAQKYWIGGSANHANMGCVFAQLIIGEKHYGVHPFLVKLRENGKPCKGITIKDCGLKEGLNGVDNGRIWFDNVRIPRENLLNRHGNVSKEGEYTSPFRKESDRFAANIGELLIARMMIGVPSIHIMKLGLLVAVKYACKRRQFGMPNEPETLIMDYLTHQKRLLPHLATCYALNFFCNYCKDRFANRTPKDIKEIHILIATLKIAASWNALDALQTSRECCGGQGYSMKNIIAGIKSDIDSFVTIDGDNTVLLQQISRHLLSVLKKQMATPSGKALFLAKQFGSSLLDRNMLSFNNTDARYLRSADFQLSTLKAREDRLVFTLAARFQKQLKTVKQSPLDAWNKVLDHANKLSMAYIQRIILESFINGIAKCEDAGNKTVLEFLRSMYALCAIESDPWFVASDQISTAQFKAIRKEINNLCGQIRPHAEDLVDAFGIPKLVIERTIAGDDWESINKK